MTTRGQAHTELQDTVFRALWKPRAAYYLAEETMPQRKAARRETAQQAATITSAVMDHLAVLTTDDLHTLWANRVNTDFIGQTLQSLWPAGLTEGIEAVAHAENDIR